MRPKWAKTTLLDAVGGTGWGHRTAWCPWPNAESLSLPESEVPGSSLESNWARRWRYSMRLSCLIIPDRALNLTLNSQVGVVSGLQVELLRSLMTSRPGRCIPCPVAPPVAEAARQNSSATSTVCTIPPTLIFPGQFHGFLCQLCRVPSDRSPGRHPGRGRRQPEMQDTPNLSLWPDSADGLQQRMLEWPVLLVRQPHIISSGFRRP